MTKKTKSIQIRHSTSLNITLWVYDQFFFWGRSFLTISYKEYNDIQFIGIWGEGCARWEVGLANRQPHFCPNGLKYRYQLGEVVVVGCVGALPALTFSSLTRFESGLEWLKYISWRTHRINLNPPTLVITGLVADQQPPGWHKWQSLSKSIPSLMKIVWAVIEEIKNCKIVDKVDVTSQVSTYLQYIISISYNYSFLTPAPRDGCVGLGYLDPIYLKMSFSVENWRSKFFTIYTEAILSLNINQYFKCAKQN